MNVAGSAEAPTDRTWSSRAWFRGALILAPLVAAGAVFFATLNGEPEMVASSSVDIAEVSTETLETVIAERQDDPAFADQMAGVRLVLAERHFSEGAYDRAFGLYAQIIEDPKAQPAQFAVSLSRVAWIGWLSNGDTARALSTLDRSLSIDPNNAETTYIKGQLLWCGAGDAAGATALFQRVLQAGDLPDDVRSQVTGDLDVASSGAPCEPAAEG